MRKQRVETKSAGIQGIKMESQGRRRRRWTQEEKRRLVEQWKQSELSRVGFCRQERLCYGAFLRWEKETAVRVRDGLVEVKIGPSHSHAREECFDFAELVAPNGWRMRLASGFDPRELATLLELVKQC